MIKPIKVSNYNRNQSFGCNNQAPKHLYHLTVKSIWNKIQKDKCLKPFDEFMGKGVFLFDLKNMIKHWENAPTFYPYENAFSFTIKYILPKGHFGDNIVLLKIPTKSLKKPLKVREYDKFWQGNKELSKKGWGDKTYEEIRKLASKEETPCLWHLITGLKLDDINIKELSQKAIEYIYPENIGTDFVKKVGEFPKVDIPNNFDAKDMFKKLFKQN